MITSMWIIFLALFPFHASVSLESYSWVLMAIFPETSWRYLTSKIDPTICPGSLSLLLPLVHGPWNPGVLFPSLPLSLQLLHHELVHALWSNQNGLHTVPKHAVIPVLCLEYLGGHTVTVTFFKKRVFVLTHYIFAQRPRIVQSILCPISLPKPGHHRAEDLSSFLGSTWPKVCAGGDGISRFTVQPSPQSLGSILQRRR